MIQDFAFCDKTLRFATLELQDEKECVKFAKRKRLIGIILKFIQIRMRYYLVLTREPKIVIEIKEITKKYGSKSIIDNWMYKFENDKIYGLIGRNGIGKTTIMKCICGLLQPDSIKLLTDQGDVSKSDYLTRNIYYVSDEPIYYNDLTLYEHLWIVCKVEGYKKSEATEMIDRLVTKFKMEEYLNFFPYALSKGTLQRMMLMIAFLRKTKNILLDEPFNGLDPIQLEQSLDYCKTCKNGKCIIISSHDIESLEAVCDCFLIFTKDGIVSIDEKIDRIRVNSMIGDSYV